MKRTLITLAIALVATFSGPAAATPTKTITSTGNVTVSLDSDTTVVRFNAASAVNVLGMSGGSDTRMVLLVNVGTGAANIYNENAGATASDRLSVDANGGYRTLYGTNYVHMGVAVYDGTSSRWRFSELTGLNSAGTNQINGDLWAAGNATINAAAGTRLILQSSTNGNNSSSIRWRNYALTNLWTMGADYNGNATNTFYINDNTNAIAPLYIDQAGTSWLSFGTSAGGMQYNESNDRLDLFATGVTAISLTQYSVKFYKELFFRRPSSTAAKPTLSSSGADNCSAGSAASWAQSNSTDSAGGIQLGSASQSCGVAFTQPFDPENTNDSQVVCTANASSGYVTVSNPNDHGVTFNTSVAGVKIYYHCHGIQPPP